ncbi:MAG: DNA polymerase III subunit gamma and tau [Nocardioides sp.]|uniref:DNA polymerase III subunit gamma and tau n=1 Tax=Nocardioides sp. TaxID=35761 RepID=UPI0039E38BE1
MESPLALYRRYRPETFAEVIGQDHVTEPLRAALANNRVNHAYLFSGPRGCGKTTSARILARSLNCAQAPTADPCGECDSCRELARGGPGSIDVIEIDAASHNGVDDARDLREKAFFAPVRDRYKVYIIDEAHMVTTQAFNALLKLVEEPPPHLRFIFATTEPEKVLPTIRSRTHHYPFRLIPPRLLSSYLGELCEKEGVAVEPAALPLIVRAGGGSARDTLSVLDQLLGGAGPDGVTHALATGLLGFTPDALLDEVVDAFAAGDGATVFGVVDKVIETGQDPRRFTEDLLRRLRDLVIVAAVPDAPATGLIDVSEDAAERLVAQAARFGRAELARAADLVASGLTEMRGATAPRLLLELICARVLLPGADHSADGLMARLDRVEKRMTITGTPSTSATAPAPPPPAPPPPPPPTAPPPTTAPGPSDTSAAPTPPAPSADPTPPESPEDQEPSPASASAAQAADPAMPPPSEDAPPDQAEPTGDAADAPGAAPNPALTLVDVRRLWPDIVEATKLRRRLTWIHLTQNAQVVAVDATTLTLGFTNAGARDSFAKGGSVEIVRQAAIDVVGADWRIEAIIDPGATPEQPPPSDDPWEAAPPAASARATPEPEAPEASSRERTVPESPAAEHAPQGSAEADRREPRTPPSAAARERIQDTRAGGAEPSTPDFLAEADAGVDRDDPDAESAGLSGAELLQQTLGAEVIEEIPHS